MRSLTASSAFNFALASRNSSQPSHYPTSQTNTHVSNPTSTKPRTTAIPSRYPPSNPPPQPQSPFFDVAGNSRIVTSRSRTQLNWVIQNSWASSTLKRYSGAIHQFIRFCDEEGVPGHLRFPADEFVLCAFAASSAGHHSSSTPRNRLSALKAWHSAHNLEWKGSTRLRFVLNGVRNLAPGSSKRPPRPPLNARMITHLIDNLDLNSPFDAAVAACAVTAFWGQCRLGELLPSNPSMVSDTPFPTRADFKRSNRNPLSCLLHLPRTKTHHHGQDIVLVDQYDPINPISLLKNHIRVSKIAKHDLLFSYISTDSRSILTKATFLHRCNTIWQSFGYPHISGHCFRIGGTTELLIAGIPPDIVKATGRWSSESFLRYWRSLDDIVPQHIRNLTTHRPKRKRRTTTTFGG
jgi:hypothetical protein